MNTGPVLLVGGTGRVGLMVRHHWPADSALMVSQRSLTPPNAHFHGSFHGGFHGGFLWAPLEGPAALLAHLDQTGAPPSALVMLAGVTPVAGGDPAALDGNAAVAVACLKAARAAGINRVLLASSSAIYGVDPQGQPFDETVRPAPLSPYGRAKLAMEAAALPFRQAGLEICALRIGNVAGADALLYPLTKAVIGQGSPRTPIRMDAFADGRGPRRSYIGPQTLARGLAGLASLPLPLPDALNLAAPRPVRMLALAQAAGWPCQMVPAPATAHQDITLDCSCLARLCPMEDKDSDAATMVAQWKATLPT